MATITTRSGKGSPLTNTEVDNNFTNLNTAKYESGDNVSLGTGSFSGGTPSSGALVDHIQVGSTSGSGLKISTGNLFGADDAVLFDAASTLSGQLIFRTAGVSRLSIDNSGGLTHRGSAVFNEDSADADFRVESNDSTHMLFVDAGNNRVGIGGISTPQHTLDVYGSMSVGKVGVTGSWDFRMWPSVATKSVIGLRNIENYIAIMSGDPLTTELFTLNTGGTGWFRGGLTVNDDGNDQDFRVESDTNTHMLFVDAGTNRVGVNTSTPAQTFTVNGEAYVKAINTWRSKEFAVDYAGGGGATYLGKLRHNGGIDGYLHFVAESSNDHGQGMPGKLEVIVKQRGGSYYGYAWVTGSLQPSNSSRLLLISDDSQTNIEVFYQADDYLTGVVYLRHSSGHDWQFAQANQDISGRTVIWNSDDYLVSRIYGAEAAFNESSKDMDFRVESDTNTHALFVDAASGTVNVNYSTGAKPASAGGIQLQIGNSSNASQIYHDGTTADRGFVSGTVNNDYVLYEQLGDSNFQDRLRIVNGGELVLNENSYNRDFRVESDTNSNGLFFDASASALGINRQPDSNGYYALDIDGVIRQNGQMVAGKVYPYSATVSRALNAPTEWFKIYSNDTASSKIVNLKIHHGGDNTNFWGEFTVNLAGYSFAHSITLENYTYYNGPQLLEIFTRTVSNTTVEIWVKVEELTSYAGNLIVQSNDGSIIASPVAVSAEPTGINARLRSTHWPGTTNRTSMAWSGAVNLTNASPVNFYRSDDTRYSRIYHNNAGMIIETQNSGDNIYIRNSSGVTGNIFLENGYNGYSVVVNDNSLDSDFRVESDSNSNMLFVDGGANRVVIGGTNQAAVLTVQGGTTTEESVFVYGQATGKGGRIMSIRDSRATAGTDGSAGLRFTSSPGTDYVIGKYYDGTVSNFMITDQSGNEYYTIEAAEASVFNQGGLSARDFRVESDTNTHMLFVDAGANRVGVGISNPQTAFEVNTGSDNSGSDSGIDGIRISGPEGDGIEWYLDHSTNGYIGWVATATVENVQSDWTDSYLRWNISGASGSAVTVLDMWHDGLVVNETSAANVNFRVESDSYSHLFFCQGAGNGLVHIGKSAGNFANPGCTIYPQGEINLTSTDNRTPMWIRRDYNDGDMVNFYRGTARVGIISATTAGVTYNTTSDRRLKENIEAITDGTEKLMAMNPVTHTWKNVPEAPAVHGFIAQEMIDIVPEAVSGDPTGQEMMSMDYGRITPVLVAALQDAHRKIVELESRLSAMEGK